MTNKTTVKGFEWNKETNAKAVELYLALVDEKGIEEANSIANLDSIAEQIGAKSGVAVRQKLVNEKAYQKPATKRKVGGKSATPKVTYIRALKTFAESNGVELNPRGLESLESAVVADIKDVIAIVEAATGKSVMPDEEKEEAKAPKAVTAKA